MAIAETYRRQVALLLRVLPHVAEEDCFALKGGTAINLFYRDMPRLSVDIDLTYLPIQTRRDSLDAINRAMKRISAGIQSDIPNVRLTTSTIENAITRLTIRSDDAQIKVEVTPVLRGCVYPPELRAVSPAVEDAFGFAEINVVSFADLFAGKCVAALDRQHPRDLFDVRDLFLHEGIDDALRRAFIVYLLSHNRPMSEVLAPTRKDVSTEFLRGFEGMTATPVSLTDLLAVRERLISEIVGNMPQEHRRFLVSFEQGTPEWSLLGVNDADKLPAIRWRQQNLDSLDPKRRGLLVDELKAALNIDDA